MTELDGQTRRMHEAMAPVLQIGPDFLAGRRDADEMAHTMVGAVQRFVSAERTRQGVADEHGAQIQVSGQLQATLSELYGCGAGYLADRCDSACVARTMTEIMREFGDATPAP
ncbi:hypothetical protein [Microbacterium kribbense]|uniref:hypothetical protein n=1 Tax=Microbacterium kribbense TaxID=433645 RepID=UPI0031CDCA09